MHLSNPQIIRKLRLDGSCLLRFLGWACATQEKRERQDCSTHPPGPPSRPPKHLYGHTRISHNDRPETLKDAQGLPSTFQDPRAPKDLPIDTLGTPRDSKGTSKDIHGTARTPSIPKACPSMSLISQTYHKHPESMPPARLSPTTSPRSPCVSKSFTISKHV